MISSDNWFRFGGKYHKKILNHIGIFYIEYSRIDGDPIICSNLTSQQLSQLTNYFNVYTVVCLEDHIPIIPQNWLTIKNNIFLKLADFNNDNWKEILFKQEERKKKLEKIEHVKDIYN